MSRGIAVRDATLEDLESIVAIYNQAILRTVATFDTDVKTIEQQRPWFDHHDETHPLLVAVDNGQVVGWVGVHPWSDRCAYAATGETALYVDEQGRGRGVGGALMQALMTRVRAGTLHSLMARIVQGNEASVRLHETHGFRLAGVMRQVGRKFGRLLDVHLYQWVRGVERPRLVPTSELAAGFRSLGVRAGDLLMLHVGVSQIGRVVGGPDQVLRTLLDVLGSEGTLMMYTSWESTPYDLAWRPDAERELVRREHPTYDPRTSPANRKWSILTEYLRTWPGAQRSPHAEGGMTAVGARAKWLTEVHPTSYGYGPGTPLARLCEAGGKVLLLGAPMECLTVLHHSEHLADLPDKRVVRYQMPEMIDGQRVWREYEEFDTGKPPVPWDGDEDYFEVIGREALATGVGVAGQIGGATARLFEAAGLRDLGVRWMESNLPSPAPPVGDTGSTQTAGHTEEAFPALPTDTAAFWALDSEATFLNHGSFGACPREVLARQTELRARLEGQPIRFFLRETRGLRDHARASIAEEVGVPPADLVLVPNVTFAVASVARSLDLEPGDELLTTDHTYNGCRMALDAVAAERGAKVVAALLPVPCAGPDEVVEAVMAAVTPRTKFAFLDHVTSGSALVLPVVELVAALQDRDILVLLDGAHAAGMVPLDLAGVGADYYTANCHKWWCAPKGAAFLYARPEWQDGLIPAVPSHGMNVSVAGNSRFHDRFDWIGTVDPTAMFSVPVALGVVGGLMSGGWSELRERNRGLVTAAAQLLQAGLRAEPVGPETMLGSIATLVLPPDPRGGAPLDDTVAIKAVPRIQTELWDRARIEAMFWYSDRGDRAAPARVLRISAAAYNSLRHYESLRDALLDLEPDLAR